MTRQIFYSFHFKDDVMRVQQIRNIGSIEGNKPVQANKWEQIKRGGPIAIKKWIDEKINYASCVVVLIGKETYKSKWVKYEIKKAWVDGKGLVGIYIHNLKDTNDGISLKGPNPFKYIKSKNGKSLSGYIKTYNPDADAYNWIAKHIDGVVETGIKSRRT